MKTYIVTAPIIDEVCIAERYGAANEYLSLNYIPGTTWWGAIASLTGIRHHQRPPEHFRRIFYSGDVIFTNLYPMSGEERAHPVPLSARTRKGAPGFRKEDTESLFCDFDEKQLYPEGVVDWLYEGPPSAYEPDWAPMSDWADWYVGDPPLCESVAVKMMIRGHNDRSGRSGTTREGLLFTRQNIARGEKFQGALRALTPEGEEFLEELVQNHLGSEPFEIPIGRQPGCVQIELEDSGDAPPYWQPPPQIDGDDDFILTITLLSNTLLLDHWLRPLSFLPPGEVAEALELDTVAVEGPYYHFSALREVSSWHGAYSRARAAELAVAAGSAFLYCVEWPKEVSEDERVRRLSVWQQRGVGLRTAEGFGEIRVNDPFHRKYQGGGQNVGHNE